MPTNIRISFDNSSHVFFAGQLITGNVTITNTNPKKCRGITITFKGYAKVHWTERRTRGTGDNRRTETIHYRSYESYYDNTYYLWGNGAAGELPPGTHQLNFNFQLPPGIPSSFESTIGQVRHECKVNMDIPWGVDKKVYQPYSVNTLYDLNTDHQAKMAMASNQSDFLCCLWCRSGPLSLVLRVDRSGFVPGESMCINAEISNKTRSVVDCTRAEIHQTIIFHARGKTRKEHRKVADVSHPAISPGDDYIWSNAEFKIPALPPSHLQYCHCIDITYYFKFQVVPSGCHMNLSYEVPIIIGSIPLKQFFNNFHTAGPVPALPYQPNQPAMPSQPAMPGYGPPAGGPINPGFPPNPPAVPGYGPPPGEPEKSGFPPNQPAFAPGYGPPPGEPEKSGFPPNQPAFAPGYDPAGQPLLPGGFAPPGLPAAPGFAPPAYPSAPGYGPSGQPPPPGFMPSASGYPNAPPPYTFPGHQEYPDMPLPTYNECVFGSSKLEEPDDDDDGPSGGAFAPKYASYNMK